MGYRMTIEQAIAKAQKLIRVANSTNAHEAATAAQLAQEILARYDIDAAALANDADDIAPHIEEPIEKLRDFDTSSARLATWKSMLATRIGRVNACQVFSFGSNLGIVGRASDVAKVRYLYAVLCGEVDRLTATLARGKGRGYANSFRIGCVEGIGDKMDEARANVAAAMRAENTGAALARIDKALARLEEKDRELARWLRDNTNFSNRSRSAGSSANGRSAGYAAGQSVNVGGGNRLALGSGARRIEG